MEFTTNDHVHLNYTDTGETDRQPVVFIPGIGGSSKMFMDAGELFHQHFRVITLDPRNQGLSEHTYKGQRISRHAIDVRELFTKLDLKNVIAIGNSMGASTFWAYISLYGKSRLAAMVDLDQSPKMVADNTWKYGFKELTWSNYPDYLKLPFGRATYAHVDDKMFNLARQDNAIFEAHLMILQDEEYLGTIGHIIRTEKVNAEYAVWTVGERFSRMFADMDDDYMKARSADIRDISSRLVENLMGGESRRPDLTEPSVLVAEDLSPSETMQMDRGKVLAFVTVHGSAASHTAILARMMGIPALTGVPVDLEGLHEGMTAVVDGDQGQVIFDPSEEVREWAKAKIQTEREKKRLLQKLKGKESITLDGKRISLCANIAHMSHMEAALENDAEGVGLFRSEFLYMDRQDFPTEEEQFQVYRQAVQAMDGKKVIIRTLDMGADKQADYFKLEKEENPAMGYRGIRICLKQTDIFKTQLRALLRAAVYGNLSIMYPMIISVEEVRKIQELVQEVQKELEDNQIPCRLPEQGIMIETPAAVMVSDELAELVDFFSIGTNDLTQYTLAVDRQNGKLEDFYQPHHKAILRMIQMVVENAHKRGIWVGICGELAADLELTEVFLRMGVDELSTAPSMILKVREEVRGLNLSGIL